MSKIFSRPRLRAAAGPGPLRSNGSPRLSFTERLRACGEFQRRAGGDCGFLAGDDGFGAKLASKGIRRFSIAQSWRVLGEIRRRTGGGGEFSQGGGGFGVKIAGFARAPWAEGAGLRGKGFGQSIALVAVTILLRRQGLASGLLNSVLHDGGHPGGHFAKRTNLTNEPADTVCRLNEQTISNLTIL